MNNFEKINTDAFIATIISLGTNANTFVVAPKIVEMDSTPHAQITVATSQGILPQIGDEVLIVTMRNPIDFSTISRYFNATAAKGIIVAVTNTSRLEYTQPTTFDADLWIKNFLKIGDGDAHMVRGEDLKTLLTQILQTLTDLKTWATALACPPPTFAPVTPLVTTVPTIPSTLLSTQNTLE